MMLSDLNPQWPKEVNYERHAGKTHYTKRTHQTFGDPPRVVDAAAKGVTLTGVIDPNLPDSNLSNSYGYQRIVFLTHTAFFLPLHLEYRNSG
jgi:hypothetical protein